MTSFEADPVEFMRQALEEEEKIAPEKRFDALVRAGIINEEGQLIRDSDEPAATDESR